MTTKIIHGDSLDVLRTLEPNSIDALVTDPPAGINFMNMKFDSDRGGRDAWIAWLTNILAECYRVAKPGAHAVVWALPRTSGWTHRALENAGWEVRDCITHLFGSGFPKSLDVSKAIDKAAGAERERVRPLGAIARGTRDGTNALGGSWQEEPWETAPATPDAERWQGWGTALKPAAEFWYLARKPLIGTVAANVLAHGTGALNIDGCRVEISPDDFDGRMVNATKPSTFDATQHTRCGVSNHNPAGRWPPNVLLSPDAAALLDAMSGERKTSQPGAVRRTKRTETTAAMQGGLGVMDRSEPAYGDTGGASRFFPVLPIDDPDTLRFAYRPKASRAERNRGLDGMPERTYGLHDDDAYRQPGERKANHTAPQAAANHHPTVKPLALMQWLVRLVTPPGGTVLDPFLGSGTTLVAAGREGFDGIGIELEPDYVAIAQRRIAADAPLFMDVAP